MPFALNRYKTIREGRLKKHFLGEMKRSELIRHIKKHAAVLIREGRKHSIYQRGEYKTQVPRHNEIVDELARKICKDLKLPFVR
jgi:mRNA interferase HicA